MTQNNYYRIQLASEPFPRYEYGDTAEEAIQTVKDELYNEGFLFLGNATARLAVYGEWKNPANAYTNGGQFLGRDM